MDYTKWTQCVYLTFFIVAVNLFIVGLISSTSLSGDLKIWQSNTNLNNELNWKDHRQPCMETIDKRLIVAEENLVMLIPSPISALGLITLLPDNVLLLFDDNRTENLEKNNNNVINCGLDDNQMHTSEIEDFVYTLDGYYKSWFNPYNWKSTLYASRQFDPHSHQIPCWQDSVEFGLDPISEEPLASAFKVDFNSFFNGSKTMNNMNIESSMTEINIRVSELRINNISYNNEQLAELLQSNEYGNKLFHNLDNENNGGDGVKNNEKPITIDHSSLNDNGYCTDDAGCLCGNEDKDTMARICSFVTTKQNDNQAIVNSNYDDELTCDDPIYSTGYCNKLCSSVLDIIIIPSMFQAKYLENFIDDELYAYDDTTMERHYMDKVHIVARRVYYNKFEVTFIDGDGVHGHELATKIQAEILKGN